MYLISCDNCGVVLDGEKLSFPEYIHNADGSINTDLAGWGGDSYQPKTQCPVCKNDILKGAEVYL